MTLTESAFEHCIIADLNADLCFGSDQAFVSFPTRFATVEFLLLDNSVLIRAADEVRARAGFKPSRPLPGYPECDPDVLYNFYFSINTYTPTRTQNCIEFSAFNTKSPDAGDMYQIPLTLTEQNAIYNVLDRQCKQELGQGCASLLREAEREMMTDAQAV